jgi:two-component system, chemotaxis family, sensor kinase Cph1
VVDAARYLEELCTEMLGSMGGEWEEHFSLELASLLLPADRAVSIGLILTELIINATKYAYGGQTGPLAVALFDEPSRFRLTVADRGRGKESLRQGFGSRMIEALVSQLNGEIEYQDGKPGLRVVLTAPIGVRSRPGNEQRST